jgi:hypothetical protein
MRVRLSHFLAVLLAAAAVGLGAAPAASAAVRPLPVQDPVPIGQDQFFTGLVNGHPPGQAIIKVVCPGPVTAGETGVPLEGQPVEVEPAAVTSVTPDLGYTGAARSITAALSTAVAVLIGTFTSYYVPKNIPTDIRVPCSGTGTMVFAPAAGGTTGFPATLTVEFANVAS